MLTDEVYIVNGTFFFPFQGTVPTAHKSDKYFHFY